MGYTPEIVVFTNSFTYYSATNKPKYTFLIPEILHTHER